MKITPGQILVLLAGVIAILQKDGVLDTAGSFIQPVNTDALGKSALDIENLLKVHGVVIDGRVDKFIQLAPLIIAGMQG